MPPRAEKIRIPPCRPIFYPPSAAHHRAQVCVQPTSVRSQKRRERRKKVLFHLHFSLRRKGERREGFFLFLCKSCFVWDSGLSWILQYNSRVCPRLHSAWASLPPAFHCTQLLSFSSSLLSINSTITNLLFISLQALHLQNVCVCIHSVRLCGIIAATRFLGAYRPT